MGKQNQKAKVRRVSCLVCQNSISSIKDAFLHPVLKTIQCRACMETYGTGDFSTIHNGVDENGVDNYCRWCTDGGSLMLCSTENCHNGFCEDCLGKNFSEKEVSKAKNDDHWQCLVCDEEKILQVKDKSSKDIEYLKMLAKTSLSKKDVDIENKKPVETVNNKPSTVISSKKSRPKSCESPISAHDLNGSKHSHIETAKIDLRISKVDTTPKPDKPERPQLERTDTPVVKQVSKRDVSQLSSLKKVVTKKIKLMDDLPGCSTTSIESPKPLNTSATSDKPPKPTTSDNEDQTREKFTSDPRITLCALPVTPSPIADKKKKNPRLPIIQISTSKNQPRATFGVKRRERLNPFKPVESSSPKKAVEQSVTPSPDISENNFIPNVELPNILISDAADAPHIEPIRKKISHLIPSYSNEKKRETDIESLIEFLQSQPESDKTYRESKESFEKLTTKSSPTSQVTKKEKKKLPSNLFLFMQSDLAKNMKTTKPNDETREKVKETTENVETREESEEIIAEVSVSAERDEQITEVLEKPDNALAVSNQEQEVTEEIDEVSGVQDIFETTPDETNSGESTNDATKVTKILNASDVIQNDHAQEVPNELPNESSVSEEEEVETTSHKLLPREAEQIIDQPCEHEDIGLGDKELTTSTNVESIDQNMPQICTKETNPRSFSKKIPHSCDQGWLIEPEGVKNRIEAVIEGFRLLVNEYDKSITNPQLLDTWYDNVKFHAKQVKSLDSLVDNGKKALSFFK